jgi:hypothetical protein
VKTWKRLAWSLWTAVLLTLGVAIYTGFHPATGPPIRIIDAVWAASFMGFPTVGALIAPRMPRRPLGWILLAAPLLLMIGLTLSDVALRVEDETLAAWVLWVATVCFAGGTGPLATVPLFLPDGRLPSGRWRRVAIVVWSLLGVLVLHAAFKPGVLEVGRPGIHNPIGLVGLRPLFDLIEAALGPVLLLVLAIGVTSLFVRFRGSLGVERQQLKWLALGGSVLLACFASIFLIEALVADLGDVSVTLIIALAILCLPVSIGIAVRKTRLYDVDVVINRALVYGALTGILGSAYLGTVVVVQSALQPFTRDSDVAVAASTLAMAALFRPLRSRVQSFIDRRFYRSRYDASETLGAFSSRIRDQVDLDALGRELVAVVGTTMQPAHASLWLREQDQV